MTVPSNELLAACERALAVADKGAADCPINNPRGRRIDPREPCPKCGHGPDRNCPSMDSANGRAVGMIRAALSPIAGDPQ